MTVMDRNTIGDYFSFKSAPTLSINARGSSGHSSARILACVLLSLLLFGSSAQAYTVAGFGKGGFADFSKAIVFTGAACPVNAETVAGSGGSKSCAIPMRPVGDGSWICSAVIFPGARYQYYFEYRIPKFDSTTIRTDSQMTYVWRNVPASGDRSQDAVKDVTLPATIEDGYILYHIFGDKDVRGKQGMTRQGTAWDTEMTAANPDIAQYRGVTDVDNTGDGDTGNLNGNHNYNMTFFQNSDTTVTLHWSYSAGGDGFTPTLEGAREFDTQSASTPYGFRILRARISASASVSLITNLVFEDTVVNKVTGDTLWSPSRTDIGIGWYNDAISFTDTSLPANASVGDTFVYTVIWQDAYGNSGDTKDQNFSGGYSAFQRNAGQDFLFLVEKFDYNTAFPRGAGEGRLRLTPYVNGIPQPWRAFWTKAYIARPRGQG